MTLILIDRVLRFSSSTPEIVQNTMTTLLDKIYQVYVILFAHPPTKPIVSHRHGIPPRMISTGNPLIAESEYCLLGQ